MVIELVEIGIRGPTLLVGLHGGEVGSKFKLSGAKSRKAGVQGSKGDDA